MIKLLNEIGQCTICTAYLEHGVNPVLSASPQSRIAIIGQAPGSVVHKTGIPWDDKSGQRLRMWLGVDDEQFYNVNAFALVPMGFCYPGKGKTGDLPPRKECAPAWHHRLFASMPKLELKILIGSYAINYYLEDKKKNLTETVRNFDSYLPHSLVIPHPSPRNNIWLRKNPWFESQLIPVLQKKVKELIGPKFY